MNRWKSVQQVMVIVLALLTLVGCSAPTASPTPADTPTKDKSLGQVKGVFVDKASGEPLELTPELLLLSEGMTDAEIAEFQDNETEVKTDSSGAFLIKNVLPGDYSLMAQFVALGFTFSVPPSETVDLGTIEIEQ